jgi:glycosyltransferase involved in cell wall biosynthesis
MEALARELRVAPLFQGFQKNVPCWLTASDIACVPSHVEPLGNATLEAMAHALPVLACHVGGIPEMVRHGETGLLVPPQGPERLADALGKLISDAALRERFGRAGRQVCEQRFTLDAHTNSALAEYENLFADVRRSVAR